MALIKKHSRPVDTIMQKFKQTIEELQGRARYMTEQIDRTSAEIDCLVEERKGMTLELQKAINCSNKLNDLFGEG